VEARVHHALQQLIGRGIGGCTYQNPGLGRHIRHPARQNFHTSQEPGK